MQTSQDLTGAIADSNTGQINSLKQQINDIPTSCQDACQDKMARQSISIYLMTLSNGNMSYVYCHLGNLCGSSDGWMRIAYLDMTDPAQLQECPSELRTLNENGVKCCGQKENAASCDGLFFSSKGKSYSEICGRVTGYQWGSPDYIGTSTGGSIDSHYVEGISITYGSPRQHLWIFIATIRENINHCPCSSGIVVPHHPLLDRITFVSQATRATAGLKHCTLLINYGMVLVVGVKKQSAVMPMDSHGSTGN